MLGVSPFSKQYAQQLPGPHAPEIIGFEKFIEIGSVKVVEVETLRKYSRECIIDRFILDLVMGYQYAYLFDMSNL